MATPSDAKNNSLSPWLHQNANHDIDLRGFIAVWEVATQSGEGGVIGWSGFNRWRGREVCDQAAGDVAMILGQFPTNGRSGKGGFW